MVAVLVLAASMAFQLAAAVFAIRLIGVTGRRWSWGLVAAGILLMFMRRAVLLASALMGSSEHAADVSLESLSLAISICLAAGLAGIGPLFAAMRRSEDAFREGESRLRFEQSRLEALLRLNQLTQSSTSEITNFALEEGVRLTGSQIGYLAFLSQDESVLSMHAWSKTAMDQCAVIDKPLVYQVAQTGLWGDAVRERRPVITNDYTGPCPGKKGTPEGHVPIRRHMNVPVFDGQRIVALAGVGNKAQPYEESDVRQLTLLMQGMWRLLQRRRAEEELQNAHQRLQDIVDFLPDATFVVDQDKRVIAWNHALEQMTGASKAEMLGKGEYAYAVPVYGKQTPLLLDLIDAPDPEVEACYEYVQRRGQTVFAERFIPSLYHGEGAFVWISACPLFDQNGNRYGTIECVRDITGRKRMEEALEDARDELEARVRQRTAELASANEDLRLERYLLHSLMDNLPHNIYFKDAQSRFMRINRALADYFHIANTSVAHGKTDYDFFASEHAREAMADEQEIVRTGRPLIDKEEKETWPDGRVTWALSTKMPLYDEAGRVVGTFGISSDITEKRQAEEALRAAKEAAEAANRAKSTFLANMSHEIRTPLNAVIGMTELVLKSPLSAQQREFLGAVRDSGEALLVVINDILDFSKIEAGKMSLEPIAFPLWESLGDTMKSFSLRAHQKGLELAYCIQPDVPRYVLGDYTRLRQIVVNLVGNAVKFTDQGEVVVEVACESRTADEVMLHFTITDTGIGIPADKQTVIFEMFEQADTSMTRRHGGTGLGLAIASRLVELMNGRIWVESEVGHGSRFHFTVHLGIAAEPQPEPSPVGAATLHSLPVLVVDDNATNRRILEEILRSWNMVPTTVPSAAQAIVRLREAAAAGVPYPLVLADAQMPDVDGFTLTQQIKEDPTLANTVVIVLTSGGRPDDTARCQQLGIAAHLLKPVKPSELLNGIGAALGISPTEEPTGLPAEQPAPTRRILLAEDSIVNQKLAVALLESRGHQVVIAATGVETLAAFESQPFDLILMDVQMPEMDGLEATAAIRAREKQTGGHVPIIAMTAHALSGDRQRCFEVGMDGYIAKPVRAAELFQTIDTLFFASPGSTPSSRQVRSTGPRP